MCKSEFDLGKYGGQLCAFQKLNDELFNAVLNKYYCNEQYYDVWIIEDIHELCNETLDYNKFIISDIYRILSELYDLCDWMIFWYGNEYENLTKVYTKNGLIDYVQHCMQMPCCELYVRVIK